MEEQTTLLEPTQRGTCGCFIMHVPFARGAESTTCGVPFEDGEVFLCESCTKEAVNERKSFKRKQLH